jgi:hypothetical protein
MISPVAAATIVTSGPGDDAELAVGPGHAEVDAQAVALVEAAVGVGREADSRTRLASGVPGVAGGWAAHTWAGVRHPASTHSAEPVGSGDTTRGRFLGWRMIIHGLAQVSAMSPDISCQRSPARARRPPRLCGTADAPRGTRRARPAWAARGRCVASGVTFRPPRALRHRGRDTRHGTCARPAWAARGQCSASGVTFRPPRALRHRGPATRHATRHTAGRPATPTPPAGGCRTHASTANAGSPTGVNHGPRLRCRPCRASGPAGRRAKCRV